VSLCKTIMLFSRPMQLCSPKSVWNN